MTVASQIPPDYGAFQTENFPSLVTSAVSACLRGEGRYASVNEASRAVDRVLTSSCLGPCLVTCRGSRPQAPRETSGGVDEAVKAAMRTFLSSLPSTHAASAKAELGNLPSFSVQFSEEDRAHSHTKKAIVAGHDLPPRSVGCVM